MADIGNSEVVTENRAERIIKKSVELADFLMEECSEIKGIGIYGSVLKKKNPRDVDIVLFVAEELACADLLGNEELDFPSLLKLNVDKEGRLFEILFDFMKSNCPVDVVFLPNEPSTNFLKVFALMNVDPDFFHNIMANLQIYDKGQKRFVK